MSEYITRERALEILNDIGGCGAEPESYTAGWDEAINAAYEAIQSEPAADVAPVVHERWEPFRGIFQCSACRFGMFMDGMFFENGECTHANEQDFRLKYCPNCGAKMDGTEQRNNE